MTESKSEGRVGVKKKSETENTHDKEKKKKGRKIKWRTQSALQAAVNRVASTGLTLHQIRYSFDSTENSKKA